MLALLFALLTSVASVAPPPHEADGKSRLDSLAPSMVQWIDADADVWTVHADGMESLVSLADDGTVVLAVAYETRTNRMPQDPLGQGPVPKLTATWCDAQGVSYTVEVPIDSSTDAGVKRAEELFDKLVARQQAKHPPRPCPPP